MIKCPNCKNNIASRTYYCPLCGTSFLDAGVDQKEINATERHFPKRSNLSFLTYSVFDTVYLALMLTISVVIVLIEGFLTKWNIMYSYIVISILVYLYILLRLVSNGSSFFPQKIFMQALLLSVIFYFIGEVLPRQNIAFEYIFPTIALVSLITVSIYVLINLKYPEKHVINIIVMGLLTIIPYALNIWMKVGFKTYSLVVACIGGGFILITILAFTRRLYYEIKSLLQV